MNAKNIKTIIIASGILISLTVFSQIFGWKHELHLLMIAIILAVLDFLERKIKNIKGGK